jgi:predicted DNA-binding transcriptional regulator AlpA
MTSTRRPFGDDRLLSWIGRFRFVDPAAQLQAFRQQCGPTSAKDQVFRTGPIPSHHIGPRHNNSAPFFDRPALRFLTGVYRFPMNKPTTQSAQETQVLYLSAEQCSERYAFSKRHWLRLVDGGKAPRPTRFGRLVRWSVQSLQEWESTGCGRIDRRSVR